MKKYIILLIASIVLPSQLFAVNLGAYYFQNNFMSANHPNSIDFEVKPGETFKDYFSLFNPSQKETSFIITPVDTYITKSNEVAFEDDQKSEKNFFGKWTKLSESEITLKPNEVKKIYYTIEVPKGTELNSYQGGISIANKELNPQANGINYRFRRILKSFVKVTDTPQPTPEMPSKENSSSPTTSWTQIYFYISLGLFALVALYFVGNAVKSAHHKRKHGHTKS